MDRGAQVDLQDKVIYCSELDLYLLHFIYSIEEPGIEDESEC